jgi:hypothetical protein
LDAGPLALGAGRSEARDESFSGQVAEILIYDRPLLDEERTAIEKYLIRKYKVN